MKKIVTIALFSLLYNANVQAQDSYTDEERKAIIEKTQQQIARYQNRTTLEKGSKEYDECYKKLYTLYKKMVDSQSYQDELYLRKNFDKKLNQKADTKLYVEKDVFFAWIEQNINSTEFRNTEAAKENWLRLHEAMSKTAAEHKEYFDYITDLTYTYENFSEIFVEVATAERDEQKNKK